MMNYILAALCAYLIGSINPAYFISKAKGFDVRKRGSGNPGASNAAMIMGKKVGAIVMCLDVLKAFTVTRCAIVFFPEDPFMLALAITMCVVGHMFPFYMGFKGGKGLACLIGVLIGYSVKVFGAFLVTEFILAVVTNYIAVASISVPYAFTAVYYYYERNIPGVICLLVLSTIILCKHIENLRRIKEGTEVHFSFLWNGKKEKERINKLDEMEGKG